jgi:hypothetical protein
LNNVENIHFVAKLTQALKTTEGSWTRHQELSPILHHIVQPWTATMYDSKETILKEKLNKLESFIALQPQRPRLKTSERKWRSKKAVCADTGLFCKLPFSKLGMVSAFRVIFFSPRNFVLRVFSENGPKSGHREAQGPGLPWCGELLPYLALSVRVPHPLVRTMVQHGPRNTCGDQSVE